jgi:hypothetical protein
MPIANRNLPSWNASDQCVCWNGSRHDCATRHNGPLPDRYTRQDDCSSGDPYIIADRYWLPGVTLSGDQHIGGSVFVVL